MNLRTRTTRGPREVPAVCIAPGLAVTDVGEHRYTVTHMGSGKRVSHTYPSRDLAHAVGYALADLTDWTQDGSTLTDWPSLQAAVQDRLRPYLMDAVDDDDDGLDEIAEGR